MKDAMVKEAKERIEDLKDMQVRAEQEIARLEKELEKTSKKVREYVKKNPEKAAAVSAGVGAAMGAAIAMLLKATKKK